MMPKRTLFFGIICFISGMIFQASAVPAVPWLVEKQQPDGSKIFVYIKGDERIRWMESEDGYSLMYDSEKNIVYAEQDSIGNMIPSRVKYSQSQSRPASFRKGLRYSASQIRMFRQIWEIGQPNLRSAQQQPTVAGAKKALCILMNFPDKPLIKTQAEFDNLMNQSGYTVGTAKGSVKDFFRENSYGELELTVTVVGPYTADNNLLYYTKSNFPDDSGYRLFAKEAIEKAVLAGVNLSEFANASNNLETFHIIYAGYGDEAIGNGKQIWAHKWQLYPSITLNGVKVSVYSCSPELRGSSGTNLTGIGVICHEMSHAFGSPDYYDIDYSGFAGSGQWDLMANGSWNGNGDTPAHINIFQKTLYGWVEPIELTAYSEVENMPNSTENPVAYSIKANTTDEMYLLENRQQVKFDVGVPGHGLLIWHIHKNASTTFAPNDTHPQQAYPIVASSAVPVPNANPSSYGQINTTGAPFPGTSGKTSFTDISIPQAFTWDGLTGIEKPITNISEINNKISFTFMEAGPDPVIGFQANIEDENTVVLTWTAAIDESVVGYRIFRNNVLQAAIDGRTVTTYSQINVPNNTYEYCIIARNNVVASAKACAPITVAASLPPPTGFLATVTNGNKVVLTWTPSVSTKVTGYKIYRDNVLQYTISGRTADTYTQFNVPNGTYQYGIMAFDVILESEKVYASATVTESTDDDCVPIYNLRTSSLADKVLLRWDTPFGGWASIAGEYTWGVTISDTAVVGRKWSTSDLKGMNGFLISKIKFVPRESDTHKANYSVVVYSAVENGIPELIYQQPIVQTLSSQKLNEILLNMPVEIDASKEWIVGILYEPIEGLAYITTDNTASNDPRNVYYDAAGGWRTLKARIGYGYNYCLQVYFDVANALSPAGPVLRATPFVKYNIYRDGQLLTTVDERVNEYIDELLEVNTAYNYCVSIVYGDCVSEPVCAEAVTREVTVVDPDQYCFPATNPAASSTAESVFLSWNAPQRAGWLSISGNASNYIMTMLSEPFEMATLWRPEDLRGYHGFKLTKVKFSPYNNNNPSSQFSIVVYKTTAFGETELVYCQPLDYSPYISWVGKEFNLNTPVEIDASKDWIVGVRFDGISTFISDNASESNPRNLIRYNGSDWYTLNEFFNNFERNFYFEMYLNGNEPSASPVVFNNKDYRPSFPKRIQARKPKQKENIISAPVHFDAGNIQSAAAGITGYTIYRNNQFLATVPSGNLTYTDNTVEPNTAYTYCISANYSSGCSSDSVCVEITTKAIVERFFPIENLQVKTGIMLKDKLIKWDKPGKTLQYCANYIGGYYTTEHNFAVRISKEELLDKTGSHLTKISYYGSAINPNTANAFLCVWIGENENRPGALVYQQAIPPESSYFSDAWHEISLTDPVDISGDLDLWIGICSDAMFMFVDLEPNVLNSSKRYITANDTWSTLSYNILLKGHLESKKEVMSYSISKNDEPLASVNANTFSFFDTVLEAGNHDYCVTAVYETESSDPKCIEVVVEGDRYDPVSNLQAALSGTNHVDLTWEAPDMSQKVRGFTGLLYSSYTLPDMTYAVCFTTAELTDIHGYFLTQVDLYADIVGGNQSNMDVDLLVWRGKNSANGPERLIYEQNIPNLRTSYGNNSIQLNQPVEIDANEELWIGIRAHSKTAGVYYRTFAGLAENNPKGRNMLYENNMWKLANTDWSLSGIISPKANLIAYSITRNAGSIASLGNSILSYTDMNLWNGSYQYCVTADYTTGSSEAVCKSIQVGIPTTLDDPHEDVFVYCKDRMIYAVSSPADPIRRIEIYNLQGKQIYLNDQVNVASYVIAGNVFLPEVCIVRVITETRIVNVKLIAP